VVGPIVLGVFNALLKQLRSSINLQVVDGSKPEEQSEERFFQAKMVAALADFAAAVPDYQKWVLFLVLNLKKNIQKKLVKFSA
jgi:hypothetical protein